MENSTENGTQKLEQIRGLELVEKLENPLIYAATITALNNLLKMISRKEKEITEIQNFEDLIETKENKLYKMLELFNKKPESYLPELVNEKNILEIENLVTLVLQILTKKETPVFVREKVEIIPKDPKITATEALQEINQKVKIEKQIRELKKELAKIKKEIKKIEEDLEIADHCFTQTNAILIYLKTIFLLENFHLPNKIEEAELTVKNKFEEVKNLIENLIEKHQDIYDKCDFVVITELIEKIPENQNSRHLSLFIENLYKSEVFLLNLLTNLKSKIQNLELEETKLKTK